MSTETIIQIMLAIIFLNIASFLLGWDIAEDRERQAANKIIKHTQEQHYALSAWVQTNWPNEFHAYTLGHSHGYSRGTEQAKHWYEDE